MQEFINTRQGYRLVTSTGGVLTRRGADIILIDVPLKPEYLPAGTSGAKSPVQNHAIWAFAHVATNAQVTEKG